MWSEWQKDLEECKVLIWYSKHHDLYPLSDWIHPGAIPIGKGDVDSDLHDLPNIEWMSRHLGWLGFRDIIVSSPIEGKGMDRLLSKISKKLVFEFTNNYWYNELPKLITTWKQDIMIVYGLNISNSDLRHALLLHRQRGNKATLLSIRGLKFNVGLVKINKDTNLIEEFQEKPIDRSQLLSSNILIINCEQKEIADIVKETTSTVTDELKDEPSKVLRNLLNSLIENGYLNTVELTGISGEPWFLDLARLENWIKFDVDEFISNFNHLIQTK